MNGIIAVNKEMNMTSFDVVAILRKTLGVKKIGHCGTLDPNATGLLLLLVASSTKILPFLEYEDKEYIATLKFNISSSTYDIWGELNHYNAALPNKEQITEVLKQFCGKIKQIPPKYSAIKVNGKKLYEYARNDEEVEIPVREVTIYELELIDYVDDEIKFRCVCSSGTYIRSLCVDIATKLGLNGCMSSLVRTRIGKIKLEDAISIDDIKNNNLKYLTNETVLSDYPLIEYQNISDIINGKKIRIDCCEPLVMITNNGKIIAAYQKVEDYIYECKRGLM